MKNVLKELIMMTTTRAWKITQYAKSKVGQNKKIQSFKIQPCDLNKT